MANRKLTREEPIENLNDDIEVEEKTEKTVKKVKKFDQSDGIMCRSVTVGALFFDGAKTSISYSFSGYGDETEIEYRDLTHAVRAKSPYLFNPYFIVEDEDFIKEFPQLDKFYNEKYTTRELKDILALPVNQMVDQINALPKGAVESLKKIASTQVSNGQLDSVRKIKALDQLFGTDLNLLAEIFD